MRTKGSLAAPLFFASLAFACAGSRLGLVAPWALSAFALAGAAWAGGSPAASRSWLGTAVFSYATLVAASTLFFSPAYSAAGLYHPLLLALGFIALQRFDASTERLAAVAALGLGAVVSGWGLVQVGIEGAARAHALFETPATYAAVLNLLLIPVLGLLVASRAGPLLIMAGILLAAGLFAADSRGAMFGLVGGLGALGLLALRAGSLRRRSALVVFGVLAAGATLAAGLRALPQGMPGQEAPPSAQARAASAMSRLELYELSWHAWQERPVSGTGYLTFRYSLEQGRARVPSYRESAETWFTHNDYLQTLQELGPIGLLAILALAGLPGLMAWRRMGVVPAEERPMVLATSAGATAMACHALVDFPFYIPVCLVLYGALLGALERRIAAGQPAAHRAATLSPLLRAARTGIAVLVCIVLLRPVVAEVAAEWGLRRSAAGASQDAAFWLETARRVERADWRYHWYVGQFWDGQVSDSGRREAAQLAVAAFAEGFEVNPLEVRNLLGKISVHRRLGKLLDAPASRDVLAAWIGQAERLAPMSAAVRRERALLDKEG
jgi:O-antigen ligase